MALQDLLEISNKKNQLGQKQGLSKERVDAQLGNIRNLIAFYREYPDIFIDQIKGPDCPFKFYFYQRIFLRIVMRHRYVYATFPRAYSKSFLTMMALFIRWTGGKYYNSKNRRNLSSYSCSWKWNKLRSWSFKEIKKWC